MHFKKLSTLSLALFLLLSAQCSTAENTLSETGKLASLCKVWGLLKYYHPAVTRGGIDWDKELIARIDPVLRAHNREELSNIYTDWINGLGGTGATDGDRSAGVVTNTFTKANTFLTWTGDSVYFDSTLHRLLKAISQHDPGNTSYYATMTRGTGQSGFGNENKYEGQQEPAKEIRLLALFRYWNIIEYFYPDKYLIGSDWQAVLEEMIPEFYGNDNLPPYYLALKELFARIHDSHGAFIAPDGSPYKGYFGSFLVKIIDDKAIVVHIVKDSLARLDDIRNGDIITKINDTSLSDYMAAKKRYISASNDAVILRNEATSYITNGIAAQTKMTFERNGENITKIIHRDTASFSLGKIISDDTTIPVYKVLDGNIGYVNMGRLTRDDVKKMYEDLSGTMAIIFDTRNYPKGTMYSICEYFGESQKKFVKFTMPDYSCPGAFKEGAQYYCGPRGDKHGYNGKIIVLMNENTQSHAEFTCMAFTTLRRVTFIGSQTAGADGDVSQIFLPGGFSTYMSGLGVYYPDGAVTQRIGIAPDIEVHPTIAGILQHKDEVLDKAINFINSGK